MEFEINGCKVIEILHEGYVREPHINNYPKINYIGNKEKISDIIVSLIPKDSKSILDLFSGGCSISYLAKAEGYQVFSNDIMNINFQIAKAIIENSNTTLEEDDIKTIFEGNPFSGFMCENYAEKNFYENECKELDLYRENIKKLDSDYKRAIAYALFRRSMIRKMPYSRFTIKWEQIQKLRDEEFSRKKYGRPRSYHNKSFKFHFLDNLVQFNKSIFDNGQKNKAYNMDAFDIIQQIKADVIYMDPPYAGTMNDYYGFYGLLDNFISGRLSSRFDNDFRDKENISYLFDKLFSQLGNFKYWLLSYNSRSKPSKNEMIAIISKYAKKIEIHEIPYAYKVTGKDNKQNDKEYLFVCTSK